MARKKETEVEVIDTENGVDIKIGKKKIGAVREDSGSFISFVSDKEVAVSHSFEEALEEVIKTYNLSA